MSKENKLGVTVKKEEDFSEWYTQLIQKADLADYTKVSGCIVFKPLAWAIWEKIVEEVNKRIKKLNVKNVYFPLLIPESLLKKEQAFIKGFSPEVAWVTQAGNTKLDERLAIRPTSEAIMYDSFSKWIRSWRDLPLKYNQWSNIIRWEFKHSIPFFRTREFIFNEGHTVFATKKEAEKEEMQIINIYKEIMEDYLAIPGFIGRKTDKEKFAGAEYTTTIETYLPNGKAIQGPDFHYDGQNFAKAYNIKFLDKDGKEKYVYQNTWAISTRMLGVMFALHSDNQGLVLPPKIAPNKIIIIPIYKKEDKDKVLKKAKEIFSKLKKYNPILDDRDYSPGWKFNEAELKGIPIRIEIGSKDIKNKQVILVKRDTLKKQVIKEKDIKQLDLILEDIQNNLYNKSKKLLEANLTKAKTFTELKNKINNKKLVLAPFCGETTCEDIIKDKLGGAKTLNIPFKQPKEKGNCIYCNKSTKFFVYFGKSY
ncbi:MAG: proline--tRNA ligase [Nanoarchaeota archaeon]|nr:proline--tRNA ligase [Nanoarchaeota archaeon]